MKKVRVIHPADFAETQQDIFDAISAVNRAAAGDYLCGVYKIGASASRLGLILPKDRINADDSFYEETLLAAQDLFGPGLFNQVTTGSYHVTGRGIHS